MVIVISIGQAVVMLAYFAHTLRVLIILRLVLMGRAVNATQDYTIVSPKKAETVAFVENGYETQGFELFTTQPHSPFIDVCNIIMNDFTNLLSTMAEFVSFGLQIKIDYVCIF